MVCFLKFTYTSYNFIWLSSEAVNNNRESGEKLKPRTDMAWPSNVCATFPDDTSNILIIPSIAPLAIYFPSGLYGKYQFSCKSNCQAQIIWQ